MRDHKNGKLVFGHGKGHTARPQPASLFARITLEIRKEDPDFPKFTFHDLRHAYAVNALKQAPTFMICPAISATPASRPLRSI